MSQRFSGVNQRLYEIQRLEYLRPINFATKGAITGADLVSTQTLIAGPIKINLQGDVTGVNSLNCKGTISTESGLNLKEFTTSGKIQSDGPVLAAGQGYISFVGVGANDSNYGKNDSYYTRAYDVILPDTYKQPMYIFANDVSTFHLQMTLTGSQTLSDGVTVVPQVVTYTYNFPPGYWTVDELVSYFNVELQATNQSPIFLSYDPDADVFTLAVNDDVGQAIYGAWTTSYNPPYLSEITIDHSSLLLQRLGFISTVNAKNPNAVTDIVSVNRTMSSTFPTYFQNSLGTVQGYYWGGIKNDQYSDFWSPAQQVWVGADPTQDSRYRVLKTMTAERVDAGLSNEQLTVSTLNSSDIMSVSASITAPTFTFSTSTPYSYTTSSSGIARDNVLSIVNVSNTGAVTLRTTDTDVSYSEDDGVLLGAALGNSTLHVQSRNPKTQDTGPSLAFEGPFSNVAIGTSSTVMAPYASIKATPSSQLSPNEIDSVPGGQLVLLTTPQGLTRPKEALRINEDQQVCIGLSSSSTSRTTSTYGEKLYVQGTSVFDGAAHCTGELSASSINVSGDIVNPRLNTLETQINALITVLAENYDQIDLVANPSPTYSGLQVTNVLKVGSISPPDNNVGAITMTQATFSSAAIGAITGGSATLSNSLSVGGGIYGSVLTPSQPQITSVGQLSSLAVANGISASSLSLTGVCTADEGIDAVILNPVQPHITSIGTLNEVNVSNGTIGNLYSSTASIDTLTVNQSISASIGAVDTLICNEASVLGVHTATTIDATMVSAVTLSASSVSASGTIAATGGFSGNLLTTSQPYIESLGTLASLNVGGVATVSDLHITNSLTASSFVGTVASASQPLITSLGTLSSLNVSGISTAGSGVFNGVCSAASGFYGTIMTPSQPNITQVGTLSSLTVSGSFSFGTTLSVDATNYRVGINSTSPASSLDVAGSMRVTGVGTVGSLGVSTNLNVAGVTTSGNLKVTGVGTMASLSVSGVGTVGNINVTGVTTTATLKVTGVGTLANANVSGITTSATVSATSSMYIGGVNISNLGVDGTPPYSFTTYAGTRDVMGAGNDYTYYYHNTSTQPIFVKAAMCGDAGVSGIVYYELGIATSTAALGITSAYASSWPLGRSKTVIDCAFMNSYIALAVVEGWIPPGYYYCMKKNGTNTGDIPFFWNETWYTA